MSFHSVAAPIALPVWMRGAVTVAAIPEFDAAQTAPSRYFDCAAGVEFETAHRYVSATWLLS